MVINAKTIYKKKSKKIPDRYSYMLVLSTTKAGCSFVYLADENAKKYYENIDGIKFDGIGFAGFDRPMYIPWHKMDHHNWRFVESVPYRKASAVSTAIKQLIDGDIVQTNDRIFFYKDEILTEEDEDESSECECVKVPPVEINITVSNNTSNIVEEVSTAVLDDTISDKNDIEIRDGVNVYGIPIDYEEATVENTSVKYVNLTEVKGKNNYTYTEVSTTSKSSKKSSSSIARSMYTEDEALGIALMSINQICSTYKVSYNVASRMRLNAREYHGILDAESKHVNNKSAKSIANMINSGVSMEECLSMFPNRLHGYIKSRYAYKASSNDMSLDDLKKIVKSLIDEGDYNTIIRLENMSDYKRAIELNCTTNSSISIGIEMRNILFRNIYYAAGMKNAYSDDFEDKIELARKSECIEDISMIKRYDICTALKNIYGATYDSHHSILVGIDDIPDEVGPYKDHYLSLIYNRFNKQALARSRALNKAKKKALESNDIVAISVIFMVSASKSKNMIRNNARNGGG